MILRDWFKYADMKQPLYDPSADVQITVGCFFLREEGTFEKRRRFLKNDSMVANCLGRIIPDEVVDMQLGDSPALEALDIVAAEMVSKD